MSTTANETAHTTSHDPSHAAVRDPADTGRDDDGYAPLRTYAPVGDGRTVALVARDGDVDWMPLPVLEGTPAFSALLDVPLGGRLRLRPADDVPFTTTRRYLPGTNVLETTFTTTDGVVRVTDALDLGIAGQLPWSELARRVEGVEGTVPMVALFRPGTAFRRASPWRQETLHGHVLRLADLTLAVRAGEGTDVRLADDAIEVRMTATPGSRHVVGLVATSDRPLFLPDPETLDDDVDRTVAAWQRWSDQLSAPAPWREQVTRSALALKLLVRDPTGAVAAAATTSLPEAYGRAPGTDKNWDYRFAWVRDTAYQLEAMFRLGVREETHAAIAWMIERIREHGPEVFFTLGGDLPDDHEEITQAPGWRGHGPVKRGNGASGQLQLGIYGDLFTIVRLYVDNGHVLDTATGRMLADVADRACDEWRRVDSGMWELHELREYTTSRLGVWVALTHAARLGEVGQVPGDHARWRSEAEAIRTWVEEHCWDDERRTYTWYPGSQGLDASILLHAISGFDRGERMSQTIDALITELGDGPHLYRYSGMREEESTFVACSFWLVSALHLVGRTDEAHERMAQLLEQVPNDVGIMAEMFDPATGEAVGNLPQALSHLALVNAALTLADAPAAQS